MRTSIRAALVALMATLVVGVGASPAQAVPDAPSSYNNVTVTSAQGTWVPGVLASAQDIDVYRFTTTRDRYARVLLGNLGADYRMRILDSAGGLIAQSDRPGRQNEEVYRRLAAGTYYVRVDAPDGAVSANPYVVRFASLPEGVLLLSRGEAALPDNRRELVFEVLNNTARPISGAGWELKDTSCVEDNPFMPCPGSTSTYAHRVIPPRQRATFYESRIADMPSYAFRLTGGTPIDLVSKLSVRVTAAQRTAEGLTYTLSVTNSANRASCGATPVRNSYGARGQLLAQTEILGIRWMGAGETISGWQVPLRPLPAGTVRVGWGVNERAVTPAHPAC